ncbi:hypothetical protein E6W36_11160 [Hankyongella ginsenosidimutans]|uniref:Penicillin-binding protein transpeptidase domain-containing protein n=1 Tax=Hankyongella ginsenosidimutans TaxID=1763828 RepID=A0A4D7C476_9SPHN|nr:hypothetical protein E6W36_11160 [Hankyongella ginsenosidimutans]
MTRKALTIERRNYVLDQMAANGYISAQEHDQAVASDLVVSVPRVQRVNRLDTYYLEDIRRRLIDRFGEERVYNGGLWVYTTIDFKLQRAAERAMRRALLNFDRGKDWNGPEARIDPGEGWQRRLAALDQGADQQLKTPRSSEPPRDLPYWPLAMVTSNTRGVLRIGFANGLTGVIQPGSALRRLNGQTALSLLKPGDVVPVEPVNVAGGQYVLRQIPQISGGFVAQDPQTGHILALVGGFDARRSAFNRATQAMRQPGSAFKPFVYAVGLDNGYTPASLIVDGPFCVNQGVKLGNKCFRNFDGRISGPHPAGRAGKIAQSGDSAARPYRRHAEGRRLRQAGRDCRQYASAARLCARRGRDDCGAAGQRLCHARQRRRAVGADDDRSG